MQQVDTSAPPTQNQQPQVGASDCADSCTPLPAQIYPRCDTASLLDADSYPCSLFQVLRSEIGSLLGRIREARKTGLYRHGVSCLPQWMRPVLREDYWPAQRCHSEDTRKILAEHPWMGLTDYLLFAQGWTMGAASACRNFDRESYETEQEAFRQSLSKRKS